MNAFPSFSKKALLHSFLFLFILASCSKDDEPNELQSFYANADTGATVEELQGIWSIFEVEFEGKKTQVPGNASECPRDFLIFSEQFFLEYTFSDSYGCPPAVIGAKFELKNGVIKISGSQQELVIISVTDRELVFRTRIEQEEDGTMGTFVFTARPYTPPAEIDIYSETFQHDLILPHYDKIRFSWQPYIGFNQFERYEIYRASAGCEKDSASLVGTITNKEKNFFIDENPPAVEELCYFFRLYTSEGLLAESEIQSIETDYLEVGSIQVQEPQVQNLSVNLKWNKYDGFYFSHYEVTVRNFESGYGADYREEVIATIQDIDQTTYVDEEAPYFSNPVYTVYVYNIFGKRTNAGVPGKNTHTVNIVRPEILPYKFITQYAADPEETILYLNGPDVETNTGKLRRYNYASNSFEATAERQPESHTSLEMKVLISSYGKELIYPQGSDLFVYNASNLQFKYSLHAENTVGFADFVYLGNSLWAGTDHDYIYVFKREEDKLINLDKQEHFTAHHGYATYHMIPMEDSQILVGHYAEPKALKFSIDSNGKLQNRTEVPAIISSDFKNKTSYSPGGNHFVNLQDRKVYSAKDFSLIQNFDSPVFPTALGLNGNLVLGTANHPAWPIETNSPHQRQAQTYDLTSRQLNTYETKGYPLFVFENHLGQIISISSGLKRSDLDKATPAADLFVERVE